MKDDFKLLNTVSTVVDYFNVPLVIHGSRLSLLFDILKVIILV